MYSTVNSILTSFIVSRIYFWVLPFMAIKFKMPLRKYLALFKLSHLLQLIHHTNNHLKVILCNWKFVFSKSKWSCYLYYIFYACWKRFETAESPNKYRLDKNYNGCLTNKINKLHDSAASYQVSPSSKCPNRKCFGNNVSLKRAGYI